MTGYEKSPDYGGPPVGRWTVAIFFAVLIVGSAALVYFLVLPAL
jgi:hypothetical protein